MAVAVARTVAKVAMAMAGMALPSPTHAAGSALADSAAAGSVAAAGFVAAAAAAATAAAAMVEMAAGDARVCVCVGSGRERALHQAWIR